MRGAALLLLALALPRATEAPDRPGDAREPAMAGSAEAAAAGDRRDSTAAAPRLRLDVERHAEEVVRRQLASGPPRFSETIEVRDRAQEAVAERLRGVELDCSPSSGVPTELDLRSQRTSSVPYHADFLALAKLLSKVVKLSKVLGRPGPRYFLYAVPPVAPDGTVRYVLHDGRLSEDARLRGAAAGWELVAGFEDLAEAVGGLRRMEHGFRQPRRRHEDARLPPWVSTTCRPR